MNLIDKLKQPYTDSERFYFITKYNSNEYVFKEIEDELQVYEYTQEERNQQERERLDQLSLTPADVERALYIVKRMDFDDLQELIVEKIPSIDLKGLAIEFRAKDFYRGASLADGTRLFDVVGALLGYTSEDMDYLFENKALPNKDEDVIKEEVPDND